MTLAKITPATESVKASLASRLPSNFSVFTTELPRRNGAVSFTATPRLTDLRYDRHDRHASGKGEGKDHSYEYLFHLISPVSAGYRNDIVLNIRMLLLRQNTYHGTKPRGGGDIDKGGLHFICVPPKAWRSL
jgi:hypothetical protein